MTRLRSFALLALLAGCSSSGDDKPKDLSRPEDRFDVTRPGARFLDGNLVVARMVTPARDEPLQYYDAELENRGAVALSLEYRTIWKDASDKPLGESPWHSVEIAPGQKVVVSDETELYPDARYVKLEVRPRS